MRIRRSKRLAIFGVLPLAALSHAVAPSDFTPQLTNLPAQCNQAYTTTIPGCKFSDFTNNAHACSAACLNGLVQMNALINNDCAGVDVEETSIVGLFLLGQAIQVLCNVAVVTTTTGQSTSPPTTTALASSTMTLSSMTPVSSGMITDTSTFPQSSTTRPTSSTLQTSTSDGIIGNTPPPTSSGTSTPVKSTASSSTAAQASQKGGDVGSGGGSPFDNINNSGAARIRDSGCAVVACVLVVVTMGGFLVLG